MSYKDYVFSFIVAIIGVISAYTGAKVGAESSEVLWERQVGRKNDDEILSKRIEIVSQLIKVTTVAQMAKEFSDTLSDFKSIKCPEKITSQVDLETRKFCAEYRLKAVDVKEKLIVLQSNFFSHAMLAQIFFCQNTRDAFSSLKNDKLDKLDWWNFPEEDFKKLLSVMVSELRCQIPKS